MDDNGLSIHNLPGIPTWVSTCKDMHPSVLDLALTNEAATVNGQLSKLTVSMGDSVGSDHAMLTIHYYPLDSLAILPLPQPKGYKAEPDKQSEWTRTFHKAAPPFHLLDSF